LLRLSKRILKQALKPALELALKLVSELEPNLEEWFQGYWAKPSDWYQAAPSREFW